MSGIGASPYAYSNGAIFASEAIAMTFTIYLGESIIANEVLAKTKGTAMGWGFVALGFGLSFGVTIVMLGYISAHLNPATCLALLILGKIDGAEFGAAVAGEFLGAFLGAILVWLHYLPHFKTVPEPSPKETEDLLLRSRDALSPEALNISSYSTAVTSIPDDAKKGFLKQAIDDLKYYTNSKYYMSRSASHVDLVKLARGEDELKDGTSRDQVYNRLRRNTVQVCDVHNRLKDIDLQTFQNMAVPITLPRSPTRAQLNNNGTSTTVSAPLDLQRSSSAGGVLEHPHPVDVERHEPHVDARKQKLDRLYDAAVVADQNAKLTIFSTRPAIYSPVFNFLTEFMCTTALIYGALMMYARREQLAPEERALFRSFEGMWIGFFVFVCILGLGGPTGIAANPARDLSPRFAHFLLPIPGKGPSEWYYSWIPVIAPFVGGCAAAGLYAATELLNHSQYVAPLS